MKSVIPHEEYRQGAHMSFLRGAVCYSTDDTGASKVTFIYFTTRTSKYLSPLRTPHPYKLLQNITNEQILMQFEYYINCQCEPIVG